VKRLHGEASATVDATTERCVSVLVDIARYPAWYPQVVRAADVMAATQDGLPTRAQLTLHISRGPLERDFALLMDVRIGPGRVMLVRVPHDASDEEAFEVAWDVEEGGDSRRISLAIDASLAVPRFLPLGTIGDDLAADFVSAMARVLRSPP
jgi:hypothetical protein